MAFKPLHAHASCVFDITVFGEIGEIGVVVVVVVVVV